MEEREFDFRNEVLATAMDKIVKQAKELVNDEDLQENYESSIKIAKIGTVLKIRELITEFKEVEEIATLGIIETMAIDELKEQRKNRIQQHSTLVDINNKIAGALEDLIVDILGEEELSNIALQLQLGDLM